MAASKFTRKVFMNQDSNFVANIQILPWERETETETERETETETETERQTERQTDRNRDRERDLPFHQCAFEKSFFKK